MMKTDLKTIRINLVLENLDKTIVGFNMNNMDKVIIRDRKYSKKMIESIYNMYERKNATYEYSMDMDEVINGAMEYAKQTGGYERELLEYGLIGSKKVNDVYALPSPTKIYARK